jgi:hypothetical protein
MVCCIVSISHSACERLLLTLDPVYTDSKEAICCIGLRTNNICLGSRMLSYRVHWHQSAFSAWWLSSVTSLGMSSTYSDHYIILTYAVQFELCQFVDWGRSGGSHSTRLHGSPLSTSLTTSTWHHDSHQPSPTLQINIYSPPISSSGCLTFRFHRPSCSSHLCSCSPRPNRSMAMSAAPTRGPIALLAGKFLTPIDIKL